MNALRVARAVGGLLAIVTLLGLLVASTLYQTIALETKTITLLLFMIGALLGVDAMIEKAPVSIKIEDEPKRETSDD